MLFELSWLFLITLTGPVIVHSCSRSNDPTSHWIPPKCSPGTRFPSGYTVHSDINVAYKVHSELSSWYEARQRCANEGARLAVIDDRKKVDYMLRIAPQRSFIWIGISRTSQWTNWIGHDDGTVKMNLPWAQDYPSEIGNCASVNSCGRDLANERCEALRPFVCEIPVYYSRGTGFIVVQ